MNSSYLHSQFDLFAEGRIVRAVTGEVRASEVRAALDAWTAGNAMPRMGNRVLGPGILRHSAGARRRPFGMTYPGARMEVPHWDGVYLPFREFVLANPIASAGYAELVEAYASLGPAPSPNHRHVAERQLKAYASRVEMVEALRVLWGAYERAMFMAGVAGKMGQG